jgi:MFS family permease
MKAVLSTIRISPVILGAIPLFVLAHFGHHLLTSLPMPLLPLIRSEFSLDYTLSGFVISAFNLAYGFGQLPAGWLTDRIGPRIMLTVGICGVALAGFFVGISHTFPLMIIFLILMGIMGGGYHPAAPPLISATVEQSRRGRALGFHNMGGSASYFLAPLIATGIAASWGWRGSFLGLAIPTMIFGLILAFSLGRLTGGKTERASGTTAASGAHAPQSTKHLAVFIFLTSFTSAVLISAVAFIPLFLVDRLGFGKETAGAYFAIIYSAGLWMSPIGGYLSDRFGGVTMILAVGFLTGPVLYLLNEIQSPVGMALLLVGIGMVFYTRMVVSESFILGAASEKRRSSVLGIYYFGSMESGGVLTPVMGYMVDHLGFRHSFMIAAGSAVLVTLICSFWLRDKRN